MKVVKARKYLYSTVAGLSLSFVMFCGLNGLEKNYPTEREIVSKYEGIDIDEDATEFYANFDEITNEDVKSLPSSITSLTLIKCNFVDDLSYLPETLPNLESLYLNTMMIDDFSFLDDMPNLKKVTIYNNPYVTKELQEYLNNRFNQECITDEDVTIASSIKNTVDRLIDEDDTDDIKINKLTNYIINHYTYDASASKECNSSPFESMYNTNKCVCSGYSFMMQAMLNYAGIKSYSVYSCDHQWNLVYLDNKYYYLDITNLYKNKNLSNYFTKFNNCYTLIDPAYTTSTNMVDYNDDDCINLPDSFQEAIDESEKNKNILEKNYSYAFLLNDSLLCLLIGFPLFYKLSNKIIDKIDDKKLIKK